MSRTILRKLDGERFGSYCFGTQWETIQRLVADEFRCRPDDVATDQGTGEHDEGLEYLVVDGKRAAFMDEQVGLSPDYSETIPVYAMAAE